MSLRHILPSPPASQIKRPSSPSTETSELQHSDSPKKAKVSNACDACRRRRSRCDGNQPCAPCLSKHLDCTYLHLDLRTANGRDDKLSRLQAEISRLQAALHVLRFGGDERAQAALRDLRNTASSPLLSDEQFDRPFSTDGPPRLSDRSFRSVLNDHDTRRTSESRTPEDRSASPPLRSYSTSQLPPRDVVRRSSKLVLGAVSGLFHIMQEDEFDGLADRVYLGASGASVIDLAEVCAVSALGSLYLVDGVSDDLQTALFLTAIEQINDIIQISVPRALRILVCACAYGTLEKLYSARSLIALGLQLCRWNIQHSSNDLDTLSQHAKLFRSMIFLECWLSTSLGYRPNLRKSETDLVLALGNVTQKTMYDHTQMKLTQIGLIKAQALRAAYGPEPLDQCALEQTMKDLDKWHATLPPFMCLTALLAGQPGPLAEAQQSALVLAHILYLGTVILLNRQILVAMADARLGAGWQLTGIRQTHAPRHQAFCVDAARMIARVFTLLSFGSERSRMHIRCWLSLFELFNSCAVLLFEGSLKLVVHHEDDDTLTEDLDQVGRMLLMLRASTMGDRVSDRIEAVLTPLHAALHELRTTDSAASPADCPYNTPNLQQQQQQQAAAGSQVQSRTNSQSQLQSSDMEVSKGSTSPGGTGGRDSACACVRALRLLEDATNVLRNPFGHGEATMAADLASGSGGRQCPDWFDVPGS